MKHPDVFATIVIPPLMLVVSWYFVPIAAWLVVMALFLAFTLLIGKIIVHTWRGALIDERNKISLARLQALLWTTLVISALLVAGVHNARSDKTGPLNITVPPQLWILLGISVTSLVGSGLIKQEKGRRTPDRKAAAIALKKRENQIVASGTQLLKAEGNAEVVANGVLTVNNDPADSRWSDLFANEELGGYGRLDLGKIQMFYITVVVVFAYAVALGAVLGTGDGKVTAFPALSDGILVLLGISHTTYLAAKSVSSTPVS